MNKNELYKLIESEFKIIEKSFNELLICELSEIYYPEVTAKLTFSEDSNRFSIFYIEKGNEYFIISISEEIEALMALYVFARKTWDEPRYDTDEQKKIINAISEDEIMLIFNEQFDTNNYSFFEYKTNKLILEKSENKKYNVLFLDKNRVKKYVTEDRNMNIAYVVMYNYTFMLEEFYRITNSKLLIDQDNNFFEELKQLYLF